MKKTLKLTPKEKYTMTLQKKPAVRLYDRKKRTV